MNRPIKALMYLTTPRGEWRLFVGLPIGDVGEPGGHYPGVAFPSFPTKQQRTDALRELGFAPVSQEPWQWAEPEDQCDDEEYGPMGTILVVALVDAAVTA